MRLETFAASFRKVLKDESAFTKIELQRKYILRNVYRRGADVVGTVWKRGVYIILGAFLAAFGLEMFLTPNQIIPGGVKGISGLLSHITEMQMGVFLFLLNLPFLFHYNRGINRARALWAIVGLSLLSALTILFHPFPPLVESPPLAAFLGSLILGCGIGLIFRYAGFTDGMQQVALLLKKRLFFSIAEIIMLINLLILFIAGFLFGWEQAIYSIFGYVVMLKTTTYVLNNFSVRKAIWIKTERSEMIKQALQTTLANQCQYMLPDFPECKPNEMYIIIPSRQEKAVRGLIAELDPSAVFISASLDTFRIEELSGKS